MRFRYAVLAFALIASAFAEPQKEAYPGQREHKEPPKGWTCSNHPRAPKDHKCGCNPECTKNEDGTMTIAEDPACTVYCWKEKHCACAHQCQST